MGSNVKTKTSFLINNLLLAAAIVLASHIAFKLMVQPNVSIFLWPATGIEIAAIFIWGRKALAGLLLGETCAAILFYEIHLTAGLNVSFLFDVLLLASSILRPVLAGSWARLKLKGDQSLLSSADIWKFICYGALLPCLISSAVFTSLLFAEGHYNINNVLIKFISWYLSDILSVMVISPLVLCFFAKPRVAWRSRIWTVSLPSVLGFLLIFVLFDSLRQHDEEKIIDSMTLKSNYIEKVGVTQKLNTGELIYFLDKNHDQLQMSDYAIELRNRATGALIYSLNTSEPIHFPDLNTVGSFNIGNERYSIKLIPLDRYFDRQYSWSLWSLVFIGILYTGLTSIGLLVLTGRNMLTEREIKRRTRLLNKANKELVISNESYRHIVDRQPAIFWKINMLEDKISYVSKEAQSILGYSLSRWLKEPHFLSKKIHPDDLPKVKWSMQEAFTTGQHIELEYRVRHINGEYRWFRDVLNIPSEFQDSVECMGMMIDITEKKNDENKIKHLAFYDYLTNLPNRQNFQTHLDSLLKEAKKNNTFGAVMFLDMDRFKVLNDSLGHQFGDRLLVNIAERLKVFQDQIAMVARFGGDEFVLATCAEYKNTSDTVAGATQLAEEVIEALAVPYQIDDHRHTCTVSLGLAVYPNEKASVNDIIKQADTAMYRSKEHGRNQLTIFHESMKIHNDQALYIEQVLRDAVVSDNFILKYQPILNKKREMVSYEALLRIFHNNELIYPNQFIKVAEETGVILEMGRWVIEKACSTIALLSVPVAVNVSSIQFHQQGFIKHITSCVNQYAIAKGMLTLELTEGVVMGNVNEIIYKFKRLSEMGVLIAIDDFGTGYSSLEYLRKIPIDYLKIDRSFINDMSDEKSSHVIVETIIAMAKHLGLKVVAEGIETEQQYKMLHTLGCDFFQGYLFSRPADIQSSVRSII